VKLPGKKLWLGAVLVLITSGILPWLLSDEPYYQGKPVSGWAIDYSRRLYPSGTAPLSPSQEGLDALREMGPQKAAIALVHALMRSDSTIYQWYRSIYSRFPLWYQQRFPVRLTHQQEVTMVLGAVEFFQPDYEKAMVPFVIAQLDKPDPARKVAICELLAKMSGAAAPGLPALRRLTTSTEPVVREAARIAVDRIAGQSNLLK